MNRRNFVSAAAGAPLLAAPADVKRSYFELQHFQLRNGTQPQRTNDFFSQHFLPAAQKTGVGPIGFFNPVIGERSPYLLMLVPYRSVQEIETFHTSLAGDPDFRKGAAAYYTAEPGYVRMESTLLLAFEGMPNLEAAPSDAKREPRLFELRTYESNNGATLRRKIHMFNTGEMGIFQRLGMMPVFFGEALVGSNLPHLTYMLSYEDLAARERLWKAFGSDPEWIKMRSQPGNADAEIVSNISNSILRPTSFSQIR